MNSLKGKIVEIIGAITTSLGGVGVAIAEFGLCICTMGPLLSLAGVITIIFSFLAEHKIYFIVTGVIMMIAGIVLHIQKKTCKTHTKKKNA